MPPEIRHWVRVVIDDDDFQIGQFPFYRNALHSADEVEKCVVWFRAFLIRQLGELDRGDA